MNIKKKNFIIYSVILFAVACLLSCGIFALADSVKFKLGITLKPSICFALSLKIDNGEEQWIFDNRPTNANKVVTWANVKNLTISLENDDISTAESLELRVYNYNADKYMSFEVYDTAGGVLSVENNGIKNLEYNQFGILNLKTNAVVNGVYQFKVKAEIYDEAYPYYDVYINDVSTDIAYFNTDYETKIKYSNHNESGYCITISKIKIGQQEIDEYEYNNGNLVISGNVINNDIYINIQKLSVWNGGVSTNFMNGVGTSKKPFEIHVANDLALMSYLVNNYNSSESCNQTVTLNNITTTISESCDSGVTFGKAYYKVCNHIILNNDFQNYKNWSEATTGLLNWTPIGTSTMPFAGNFDGANYEINGLYINNPTTTYQGLFAKSSGNIENIILKSGFIRGAYYIAGICAHATNTISNCVNYCNLVAVSNTGGQAMDCRLGGVCGFFGGSVIKYSANYGFINGNGEECGGVLGILSNGSIHSCYNKGRILSDYSGGIVGYAPTATLNITNCFNSGTIDLTNNNNKYVGGIFAGDRGKIENCYNNGNINTTLAVNGGGIYGNSLDNSVTQAFCYSTTQEIKGKGSNGNVTINPTIKLLNTNVTVGSYTGNNLLDALNAYVEANPGNGYLNWVEGPDGWPVFGTIKN